MLKPSLLIPVLGAAFGSASLSSSAQQPASFAVRDSAGVRIIENIRPQLEGQRSWRIESRPTLVIGANTRAPEYQFSRIDRVARFTSGRIAIANSTPSELRIYAPNGSFVRRVGRRGDGPGEFYRDFDGVDMCMRDTLVVQMRNGIVFATADTVLNLVEVRTPEGTRPLGKHACGKGRMLWGLAVPDLPRQVTGFVVGKATLRVSTTSNNWPAPSFTVETDELFRWVPNDTARVRTEAAPFARKFVASLSASGVYIQNSRAAEVTHYSNSGAVTAKIRVRQPVRPATAAMKKQILDTLLAVARTQGYDTTLTIRTFAEPGGATSLPAFAEMLVDNDENLWVREYDDTDMISGGDLRASPRPRRWAVFAQDGHLITYVATPERFTPHQIGPDFVIGVWVDADDVPRVHMYRLMK